MKKSLPSSEWALVVSLLLIISSLVIISKVHSSRVSSLIAAKDLEQEKVLVIVEGAVNKPGEYKVPSGTLVETVIRKARPKPYANLKILPLKQLIETPVTLQVETLSEVVVFVQGAVDQPIELTMPLKSRICDLKTRIPLTQEADMAFFKSRKQLKEGDKICVPKKKVEENSAH